MKKRSEPIVTKKDTCEFDSATDILSKPTRRNKLVKRILKRLSPFLLLAFFLIWWFPYNIITGDKTMQSRWLLLALFVITLVNMLFIDFALWEYFQHKKVFKIWLIEIIFSFPIIYFLVFDFLLR